MLDINTIKKPACLEKIQICDDLDEFAEVFTPEGFPKGSNHAQKQLQAEFLPPTTYEEAEFVKSVYEIIYEGTYPFPEMLDVDWIYQSFSDPNYIWGLYRIAHGYPEEGKPIGCFTYVLDFVKATGYMRGLRIIPEYQSKINLKELVMGSCRHVYEMTKDRIFKWYCESRTAHNKTQFFMTILGARTQGILLNKDYFYGVKESDALMVAYNKEALGSKRLPAQFVIPEVLPIYEHFQALYNLNPITSVEFHVPIHWNEVQKIMMLLKIHREIDQHNYETVTIYDSMDPRNDLTGLYTANVHNIEKIHYHAVSPDALLALIGYLSFYVKINQIEYVEWQVAASDLIAQRVLKDWGFQIFGYLPAWEPKPTLDTFEDMVVFGWSKILPEISQIQLLPDGLALAMKIMQII
jgi:hypothetical protein